MYLTIFCNQSSIETALKLFKAFTIMYKIACFIYCIGINIKNAKQNYLNKWQVDLIDEIYLVIVVKLNKMENNRVIPNVSSVFRELIKISTTNPRLHPSSTNEQLQSSNYGYSGSLQRPNETFNQNSFPSTIVQNDRQQKHQALMSRLRNSVEQNRQILGIQESPYNPRGNAIYESRRNQIQASNFTPYFYPGQLDSSNNQQRNTNRKWQPPKIKYRHIQDKQQRPSTSNQDETSIKRDKSSNTASNRQQQTKLQNQFYDIGQGQPIQNKQNKFQRSGLPKNIPPHSVQEECEGNSQSQTQQYNFNQYSVLSQKPSKYNQNLESYFDICRRPVKPSVLVRKESINEQKNINTEKFLRRQIPKVEGINLQKAMRILSLQD